MSSAACVVIFHTISHLSLPLLTSSAAQVYLLDGLDILSENSRQANHCGRLRNRPPLLIAMWAPCGGTRLGGVKVAGEGENASSNECEHSVARCHRILRCMARCPSTGFAAASFLVGLFEVRRNLVAKSKAWLSRVCRDARSRYGARAWPDSI